MADHIVKAYGEALDRLKADVSRMGDATVRQINRALEAHQRHDRDLAQAVVRGDKALDIMEAELEHDAVRLIALRQPVADDLRRTLAAMKIASNLERCGDLARSIAWRIQSVDTARKNPELNTKVETMWRLAGDRLEEVMRAQASDDVELALKVSAEDDLIDDQFDRLFTDLVAYMTADSDRVTDGAHLLYVTKNLERIGDHATNIAEIVVYQVTGETIGEDGRTSG